MGLLKRTRITWPSPNHLNDRRPRYGRIETVKHLIPALIPVALAGVALAAASTGGAAVIVNEHETGADIAFSTDLSSCSLTPEIIRLEGRSHHVFRWTETSDGVLHVADEVNAQARGVGQTTGTLYIVRDQFTIGFNAVPGAAMTQQYVETFRVIQQGSSSSGDDLIVTAVFMLTIDATGNVTASVENFRLMCN
jgi:hypothetical protein